MAAENETASVGGTATASPLIVGMRVDVGSYAQATAQILRWAQRGESRSVCAANVHMAMETRASDAFREVVNSADLVTADGMPLVWVQRWRGYAQAQRVYGPTLMLHVCEAAAQAEIPIGLFGGTDDLLDALSARLWQRYPSLKIAHRCAPPFRVLTGKENDGFARDFQSSGARIIFVGLGCPKQEQWIAAMRGKIPAVMIGVGAAFNFHAGRLRQAPVWVQRLGLEWLFRLAMEPRRLWRRYTRHNAGFVRALLREEWHMRRR